MTRQLRSLQFWMLLAAAVLATLGVGGCATTAEDENASVRPWNAPKGWEYGLPSAMTDRR